MLHVLDYLAWRATRLAQWLRWASDVDRGLALFLPSVALRVLIVGIALVHAGNPWLLMSLTLLSDTLGAIGLFYLFRALIRR